MPNTYLWINVLGALPIRWGEIFSDNINGVFQEISLEEELPSTIENEEEAIDNCASAAVEGPDDNAGNSNEDIQEGSGNEETSTAGSGSAVEPSSEITSSGNEEESEGNEERSGEEENVIGEESEIAVENGSEEQSGIEEASGIEGESGSNGQSESGLSGHYGSGVVIGEGKMSGEGSETGGSSEGNEEEGNNSSEGSGEVESGSGVIVVGSGNVWLAGGVARIPTSYPNTSTDEIKDPIEALLQFINKMKARLPSH